MKNLKTLLAVVLAICLVGSNIWWYQQSLRPVEKPKVLVRFAKQYGFHYGPQIVMEKFKLVEKYSGGVAECEWNTISGGTTINEAIVAGSLDFAAMGPPPAIKGIDQGIETRVLLSMGAKEHELWTWREDIQTITDIKPGHKVCLLKVGSIEETGLIKAFSDLGRTKEDVEKVAMYAKHPEAYQLMEQREIDVDFTGAPYTSMYASDPAYHKIGCDSEIWGVSLPGSCFIGTEAFEKEHPEVFITVVMAWIEAVYWIKNNQREAADMIGEYYEYEPEKRWDMWVESKMEWGPFMGLAAMDDLADMMFQLGMLTKKLTLRDILFEETLAMVGE